MKKNFRLAWQKSISGNNNFRNFLIQKKIFEVFIDEKFNEALQFEKKLKEKIIINLI